MARECTLKLGKQRLTLSLEPRTVVLCDSAEHATRVAAAVVEGRRIDGADGSRSRVGDLLPKRTDPERVQRICSELRLDEAVLDWRLRDCSPLQRAVAQSVIALAGAQELLVFDVSALTASPFDAAHLCAHMRRVADAFSVSVLAVISDAALISSAGSHLAVIAGEAIVEAGPVSEVLASPRSEALLSRLEATPIASPMAMQMRRVQRVATRPVNYAHTTIIQLPTQESIALAGGDEE